ncbi:MAG TPA: IgGFc-binding protein [Kofleriaceae bacterium]|jgi:hypothetical protein
MLAACGPGPRTNGNSNSGGGDDMGGDDTNPPPVCPACTADGTGVIDCQGGVTPCGSGMGCSNGVCENACQAAEENHSSVGCDYWAIDMDAAEGPPMDACYTVFVANTSPDPVHINVTWHGNPVDMAQYAKLPQGEGTSLTYGAYDPVAGLESGKVAIIFLAYALELGNVSCPVPAAVGTDAQINGTGTGYAFHVTTDSPVVAYQMLPYGGGAAAATGASLLVPASAWDTEYIAVSAWDDPAPPIPIPMGPSHNVVASQDNTTVTITPIADIAAGGGLPAGTAGQPWTTTLMAGQYLQITQLEGISGSPITADKPVGVFGGHQIMSIDRCCGDHGEQMHTPVRALGNLYVAAAHGDRKPAGQSDPRIFHIYGAVDGTQLHYDPASIGGAATVDAGGMVEIRTETPFTVQSQDDTHPFAMYTYMSGAGDEGEGGWGDPDFVRLVPPAQYLSNYVFFTDVTYPFTVLTIVRQVQQDGTFADVDLDCLGSVPDWTPVGVNGEFQITHVKLVDHFNPVGNCNNGVHVMTSPGGFGVWVWGWGSEDTNTGWVSYGYPAGEGVRPINNVVIGRQAP